MFDDFKYKWSIYWANFSWDSWVPYLNGRIARIAILVPIVGYLIIFNDFAADNINFTKITNATDTNFFLDEGVRLKLVYFGLISLALGNAYFHFRRPHVVKQGSSLDRYMEFGLSHFTVYDFSQVHDVIETEGHTSVYGKYYSDDWDAFLDDARWSGSGHTKTGRMTVEEKRENRNNVSFSAAKKTHEDLLRSLLIDTYKRETMKRRPALIACIMWASLGYLLLLVPSVDLFLRVMETTFHFL